MIFCHWWHDALKLKTVKTKIMLDKISYKIDMSIDDVHIWTVCTDKFSDETLNDTLNLLSTDEKKRAKRYHFVRDQKKYIIARGILRKILSCYVEHHPRELLIKYNSYGKPFLVGNQSLFFNVSHSDNLVLYGFTKIHRIGVDIERLKPIENLDQIVDYYFTIIEKDQFARLPPHMRNDAFFRWWTLKEAYVKSKGKGLSLPLNEFSVSFMPGEKVRLIESKDDKYFYKNWFLNTIKTKAGYIAAIAVEGCNRKKIRTCFLQNEFCSWC